MLRGAVNCLRQQRSLRPVWVSGAFCFKDLGGGLRIRCAGAGWGVGFGVQSLQLTIRHLGLVGLTFQSNAEIVSATHRRAKCSFPCFLGFQGVSKNQFLDLIHGFSLD